MSGQSGGVREGAGDDQGGQEQQYSSGVQEGARDDQRGEERHDSAGSVHVFRGPMHGTVMGSQTVVKNINKTFMPDGSFGQASEPGKFEVGARIVVLENRPISISSRVFHAKLHSEVTGIKEIVVKITPHDEKHQREAKIHFSVPHHKNIVERILTDVFNFRGQSSIYIAMELCDCNLYDHIKSQVSKGIPFEPQKYLSIVYQVVVGLDFLHSHNVVHGDLKPSNVLLMLDGNLVKLSDFGLSRAISDDKTSTQLTSPQGGTAGWLAPEILEGTTRIAPENDIFPLGLVCNFAWSYGKHPYGDQPLSWNHYISEGTNLNLDRMLIPNADSAKDLLTSMLLHDPADRPTAKQVLKHRIFASQVLNYFNQGNDAQVTEVVEKAFRTMSCTGGSEGENEVIALGCTSTQLSNVMKRVLDQNKLEISRMFGDPNHPSRVSDAQVTEIMDKAFRAMPCAGASEGEYEVTALGCTIAQLSNVMKRVLDQNKLEVGRMFGAPQRPQSSAVATQTKLTHRRTSRSTSTGVDKLGPSDQPSSAPQRPQSSAVAAQTKRTHRRTSRSTSTTVDERSPSDQPSSGSSSGPYQSISSDQPSAALQRPQSATRPKELYDEREPGRLVRRTLSPRVDKRSPSAPSSSSSSSGRYETSPIGTNARRTTYEVTITQGGSPLMSHYMGRTVTPAAELFD